MQTRSRQEVSSGQEEEHGVAQPIFTPVLHPGISSTSHAALVKWRKERKVYEDTMRARCQTSGENYDAVTTSIKESFDRKLLETCCKLRWRVNVEDVTDDRLRKEIDEIINSVKNHTLPDVQALFNRDLQLDLSESDVSERVLQYFMTCDRIIEEHGLQACFESDSGKKEKCSLLVNSITPEELKEEIQNALRYQSPEAKADECKLHDLILAKALEQDRDFCRSKRKRATSEVQGVRRLPVKKTKRDEASRRFNRGDSSQRRVEAAPARKHAPQTTRGRATTVPDKGCLKCGGAHWVVKCPEASEAEKKDLPKQFHKNKGKSGEANMKRLREDS